MLPHKVGLWGEQKNLNPKDFDEEINGEVKIV